MNIKFKHVNDTITLNIESDIKVDELKNIISKEYEYDKIDLIRLYI